MTEAHQIEQLAVALYESDCRERAGDMARRTTLSRVRAFYGFASWLNLSPRERDAWRERARRSALDCEAWSIADEEWRDAEVQKPSRY